MQTLDALLREAQALAGSPVLDDPQAEVARVMTICNACRYCEGFCAVFPAMTRRIEFGAADVHYLANLCHNCGACLHACQYAPPHDFQLNVPQAMARVRATTYADYAWPPALGRLYQRNGLTVSVALALGLALFLVLAVALNGTVWRSVPSGNFYAIFPHNLMVGLFLPVFAFATLALGVGVTRFWRMAEPFDAKVGPTTNPFLPGESLGRAVTEATKNALTLKYLDGGHGDGCNNEDDAFTHRRRHAHHATFYGFALCFAATSVGTLYHYGLGWVAPYAYLSVPKVLGTLGGVLMVVGTVSLWRLNRRRHPLQGDAAQKPMDLGFIALLMATAVTGLALTALRSTPALPLLLAVHLGVVLALFATMPYGKFAHGIYRGAALVKWSIEKRRPTTLDLGSD